MSLQESIQRHICSREKQKGSLITDWHNGELCMAQEEMGSDVRHRRTIASEAVGAFRRAYGDVSPIQTHLDDLGQLHARLEMVDNPSTVGGLYMDGIYMLGKKYEGLLKFAYTHNIGRKSSNADNHRVEGSVYRNSDYRILTQRKKTVRGSDELKILFDTGALFAATQNPELFQSLLDVYQHLGTPHRHLLRYGAREYIKKKAFHETEVDKFILRDRKKQITTMATLEFGDNKLANSLWNQYYLSYEVSASALRYAVTKIEEKYSNSELISRGPIYPTESNMQDILNNTFIGGAPDKVIAHLSPYVDKHANGLFLASREYLSRQILNPQIQDHKLQALRCQMQAQADTVAATFITNPLGITQLGSK